MGGRGHPRQRARTWPHRLPCGTGAACAFSAAGTGGWRRFPAPAGLGRPRRSDQNGFRRAPARGRQARRSRDPSSMRIWPTAPCAWSRIPVLRVAPRRLRDRPSPRQPFGCAHRDCHFRRYGLRVNGRRLATVSLPTDDTKDLRAGQVFKLPRAAPRQVWHSALPVPDLSPAAVQALRAEWAAATAGAPSSTCM